MRTKGPMRGGTPTKRLDLTELRMLLRDRRIWSGLGVVKKPDDSTERYQLDATDMLVHVVLVPEAIGITCRMGVAGGGPGMGFWAIPPEGSEVAVIIPTGEADFMPIIVAVLSTGTLPDRVSPDRWTIVSTVPVELVAPKVYLGPAPETIVEATDGLVHGQGIDPFTGTAYSVLGNTTGKVFSKK